MLRMEVNCVRHAVLVSMVALLVIVNSVHMVGTRMRGAKQFVSHVRQIHTASLKVRRLKLNVSAVTQIALQEKSLEPHQSLSANADVDTIMKTMVHV